MVPTRVGAFERIEIYNNLRSDKGQTMLPLATDGWFKSRRWRFTNCSAVGSRTCGGTHSWRRTRPRCAAFPGPKPEDTENKFFANTLSESFVSSSNPCP